MLQPQKVEAIYENGVLHLLEPLDGFAEHCKVRITVEYEETPPHPLAETRIQKLRKQLLDEGCDEELVQLIGTVPTHRDNYKEEIRTVIYERAQRKP